MKNVPSFIVNFFITANIDNTDIHCGLRYPSRENNPGQKNVNVMEAIGKNSVIDVNEGYRITSLSTGYGQRHNGVCYK